MKLEFLPLKKIVPPPFRGGGQFFYWGVIPPLHFPRTLGGTRQGTNFFKNFWGGGQAYMGGGIPPVPPCRENPGLWALLTSKSYYIINILALKFN